MCFEHKKVQVYWVKRESIVYDAGNSASLRVGDLLFPLSVCWTHELLWVGILGLRESQSLGQVLHAPWLLTAAASSLAAPWKTQ